MDNNGTAFTTEDSYEPDWLHLSHPLLLHETNNSMTLVPKNTPASSRQNQENYSHIQHNKPFSLSAPPNTSPLAAVEASSAKP